MQDGEVTTDEFKKALQNHCVGKSYNDFPKAFKAFIDGFFRTVDIDGRNWKHADTYKVCLKEQLKPHQKTNDLLQLHSMFFFVYFGFLICWSLFLFETFFQFFRAFTRLSLLLLCYFAYFGFSSQISQIIFCLLKN